MTPRPSDYVCLSFDNEVTVMINLNRNDMPHATTWQRMKANLHHELPVDAPRIWAALEKWIGETPEVYKLNSRKRNQECAKKLVLLIKAVKNGF